MSRIFIEGFEIGSGTPPGWTYSYGPFAYVNAATYGLSGNYAVSFGATTTYYRDLLSARSEVYLAFKIYIKPGETTFDLLTFVSSNGVSYSSKVKLNLGRFEYQLPASLLAYSGVFASGSVYSIEIWCKPRNSGGRFTMKVDGTTVIDYTGDNVASGNEDLLTLCFGYQNTASSGFYLDDVIADTASWIGNSYVQAITVTGAGSNTQWTPSAGSNYQCVDEVPYSDSDYISTNTINQIDTYAMSNMVGSIISVGAVRLISRGMYEGSPSPTKIKHVVRQGGTDYPGVDLTPPVTAGYVESILTVSPDDSAAWEVADVDGMEVGVKAVA
jgi:hypothetical protein